MINLKKWLEKHGLPDSLVLDDWYYDSAAVGITDDGRVVYDYHRMVHALAEVSVITDDDAADFIDHNVLPSLGPMGPKAPIVMYSVFRSVR